jgi:hypothetical protein
MEARTLPTAARPLDAAKRNPGWTFMQNAKTERWRASFALPKVAQLGGGTVAIVIEDAHSLESCETRVRMARASMMRVGITGDEGAT